MDEFQSLQFLQRVKGPEHGIVFMASVFGSAQTRSTRWLSFGVPAETLVVPFLTSRSDELEESS